MIYAALSAASERELPLIKELWLYFYDTYLNSSVYYEHLNIDTGKMISIRIIILGLYIGIAVAGFAAVFNKRVLGGIVRRLLSNECFSPETAKTLDELGYGNNFIIYLAVGKSTSLRRVVKCREELEFNKRSALEKEEYEKSRVENKHLPKRKETEYKTDAYSDSFFIPEEIKYTAETKFDSKGSTWLGAVILTLVMTVAFFVTMAALPYIFSILNDFVGSL